MGEENKKYRVINETETTIGNTTYIVRGCVPADCTDEQVREQTRKKIERLILTNLEHEKWDKKTT